MEQTSIGRRLGRSAAAGLCGALAIAAVVLLGLAVLRLQVDCAALSAEECSFEKGLAANIARLQAFAALGCGAVAAGGFLLLKRRT
ncbi:MAG: hypothetical protein JNJ54_13855 [Myxococcaceae bacterium]|nr:hypothetical protein [Myxococcaceae bacterium]